VNKPSDDPYVEEKAAILEAALIEADFDGWSLRTLRSAADKAGISRDIQRLAFPRGVVDLVGHYSQRMDDEMAAELAAHDLSAAKVREKITLAVRLRIAALAAHKQAAYRAVRLLVSPVFAGEGAKLLYHTADRVWRACGDQSSDFSFYTKRALLAGVYSATLLHWLDDDSENAQATWDFLGRRIDQVTQIEKAKATAFRRLRRIPSPLKVLASLRYPDRAGPR
jgi:ubiquinone biosynthesis protein COQ9